MLNKNFTKENLLVHITGVTKDEIYLLVKQSKIYKKLKNKYMTISYTNAIKITESLSLSSEVSSNIFSNNVSFH